MKVWLLIILINNNHVTTSPVHPPFLTQADCVSVQKIYKSLDSKSADIESYCVEVSIANVTTATR